MKTKKNTTVKLYIIVILSLCTGLITNSGTAQKITYPSPQIGWDSLNTLIKIPDLIEKARYNTSLIFYLTVDETGKLEKVELQPFSLSFQINNNKYISTLNYIDSLVYSENLTVFKNIKWEPGCEDGKKIKMAFDLPLIFYFHSDIDHKNQIKTLLFDLVAHKVEKFNH